jgi:Cytochrome c
VNRTPREAHPLAPLGVGQWLAAIVCALLAVEASPAARSPPESAAEVGEAIYLRGVLSSGAPVEGTQSRLEVRLRGADAACVNCHQRSGLGSHEGGSMIPPITVEHLFRPRLPDVHDLPTADAHGPRGPYTNTTLARAIRSGIDPDGRTLSDLMPRFDLDDASIEALVAYLRKLTVRRSPGVTEGLLHLATVVTPDADPVKRRGVLDVLEHYVAERNSAPLKPSPQPWASGRAAAGSNLGMANRRWQLHVWELAGSPDNWHTQLERQFAGQPVFALLSGIGGAHWEPVHEFCERHAVACLFPNVEVPVISEEDFYSVYFFKGVLLEAELMARSIIASRETHTPVTTVRQVYRRGDSGEAAAAALATGLRGEKITVSSEAVPADAAPRRLGEALARRPAAEILVLWLRSHDLAALDHLTPPSNRVYLSGFMSGLENAPVARSWRANSAMSYPFELPQRRGVQVDYARGWLSFKHIPVVDPQAQADTYLACTLLSDTLKLMGDHASPPYLIERLQELLEHRSLTGYYPRLALATRQHFASKGGYIVHFEGPEGPALVADTPWTVP